MPAQGNVKEESTSEHNRAKIVQKNSPEAKKNASILVF